jgi:hypothetical protein
MIRSGPSVYMTGAGEVMWCAVGWIEGVVWRDRGKQG